MKLKPNPFRPDKPVTEFDLFAGRAKELEVLIDALYQIGHGNPKHTIVTGPRGIGKSSFINQIQSLTKNRSAILRELAVHAGEFGFKFAVYQHIAMKNQTTEIIVTSLIDQMRKDTKGDLRSWFGALLEKWKPKFKVPTVGEIEYQPQNLQDTLTIGPDFIEAIGNLWDEIKGSKDGIVIIIDEVDTVATDTDIASFLKTSTELLLQSGLDRVSLYLGGITDAIEKLKGDHASIGRVFETVELSPMSREESRLVITKTLGSGVESSQVEIKNSAIERVVEIAEGFPAVIHQLCYHAYRYDADSSIDDDDVQLALHDVVTRVRREELDESLSRAGTGYARKILFVMANDDRYNVPLADIAKRLSKPTNEVSSPITKLVRDEKVVRVERALYRIKDPLLRLYIRQLDEFEQSEKQRDDRQMPLEM